MKARLLLTLALVTALAGCAESRRYDQAICVLLDVSGTYADQKAEVVRILKREILPTLVPGDTLVVIRIDSQSYEKDNVEAVVTLDPRPSKANAQKLALAQKLDAFAARAESSTHTDIPGAMMLGAEYLRELGSESRVMLVFSDMAEDLPDGSVRKLSEHEFEGVQVVAMNVKRLQPDAADPERFRARLASWEERATGAGAVGFRTFQDDQKLGGYLADLR